jgi:hypothetical protein
MDDEDEDDEDEEMAEQSVEEVTVIADPNTPTRRNLPFTVVVKRRRKERRPRKECGEHTWTMRYFNVTALDETWVNTQRKGHLVLQNRLWTCKFCKSAFSFIDKARHGNTTHLNNHLRDKHEMTRKKHDLSILPINISKA